MAIIDTESSETTYTPEMDTVLPCVAKSDPVSIVGMMLVGDVNIKVEKPYDIQGSYNMVVYSGDIGITTSHKDITEVRIVVTQLYNDDDLAKETIVFSAQDTIINRDIDEQINKSIYFRANTGQYSILAEGSYTYKLYVAQLDSEINRDTIMDGVCSFKCSSYVF